MSYDHELLLDYRDHRPFRQIKKSRDVIARVDHSRPRPCRRERAHRRSSPIV